MEFGLAYTIGKDPGRSLADAFRDAVKEIQLAEALGYTTVILSSQHFEENDILPSPLVAAGMILARTERIRVGSGILIFPLEYHPIHVAEDAAVLDVLSEGRFVLGVGQGALKKEFAGFGIAMNERRPRLKEGVEMIRQLFTKDKVTYQGRYWQVNGETLHPKPAHRVPIWVAAEFEPAVALAGELGDGWLADPKHTLVRVKKNWDIFREAHAKGGKDPDKADFAIWRELYVGETDEQAWAEAGDAMRAEFQKYLSWEHLVDDDGNILKPDRVDMLDDLVKTRFVVGGPETCIATLREYKDLGVTHFCGHTQFTGLRPELVTKSMRLLAEKVMPHV